MKPITKDKHVIVIDLHPQVADHRELAFIQDILELSRGLYQYVIVQRYEFYKGSWNDEKIFQELDLHSILQQREADEIWVMGGGDTAMGGARAFWLGSSPIPGTENIYRRFPVTHFGYDLPMLEPFVRRVENTMYQVYRGYPPFKNSWEKFIKPEACGTILCPPTGKLESYSTVEGFFSSCDDWLHYPNLRGQMRYMNSNEWGGTLEGYLRWWLYHLPHGIHKTDGIHDNWWHYVMNLDLVR